MIRWKGVIFLAVLVGIFIALSLIFTDRWLENLLEDAGSQIVGARVDIDKTDFSFTAAHLRWKRLQVTDPKHTMRNLFETGSCDLNLEFWPLLSKKIIIENFKISDIRTNTPRQTDGKLPLKLKKKSTSSHIFQKAINKITQNLEQNSSLPLGAFHKNVNTDSLLKILKLQSPQKIDSLKKALQVNYSKWEKQLSEFHFENDLKRIKSQIRSINPNKIKNLRTLQKTLKTLYQVKKELNVISDSLKHTKNTFAQDLETTQKSLGQVRQWIQQDYRQALSLAKIPEINKENIARILFGPVIVNQFTRYLGYIRTARYYCTKLRSHKPKKKKPPRFKGQNIYFFSPNARPDFWIKRVFLSGETHQHLKISGQITDIISDQRFINRPTKIEINGSNKNQSSFYLSGRLNYLGSKPKEVFALRYENFPLNNVKLSASPYFPEKLNHGTGTLQANLMLQGNDILAVIDFVVTRMAFQTSKKAYAKNDRIRNVIIDVVNSIKTLTVRAKIQGTGDQLKFNLNSNLDDLLVHQLKSKLSAEIEKSKTKIKNEIDRRTLVKRKEIEAFIAQKQAALQKEIDRYQALFNQEQQGVKKQQKDIENRIAEEKKKASKKVQQKLKSLFK